MPPEIPTAHLASLERLLLILNMHWVSYSVPLPTMNTTKRTHLPARGQQELYTGNLVWAQLQLV